MQHAALTDDRTWEVTLDTGETRRYDALLVANGHHWDPRWPEPAFPGSDTFEGVQMHAHSYVDNSTFAGRNVVVLGMGNSAMDIAVESSYVAERTYLAARRGAWIVPKYIFGRPIDQMKNDPRVPFAIRQRVIGALIKAYSGSPERYGLPKPDHRFGEAHPTVSGRILDRIAHGTISPEAEHRGARGRPGPVHRRHGRRRRRRRVLHRLQDQLPVLRRDLLAAPDNHIELFRRVFHPDFANLAFIGLLQPLGALMPLAELQGEWVSDYLCGRYALPDPAELRADIARDQAAMRKRYVTSKRHTIQVDFDDYVHDLTKERKAGAERARAAGHALPVAPRVASEALSP